MTGKRYGRTEGISHASGRFGQLLSLVFSLYSCPSSRSLSVQLNWQRGSSHVDKLEQSQFSDPAIGPLLVLWECVFCLKCLSLAFDNQNIVLTIPQLHNRWNVMSGKALILNVAI